VRGREPGWWGELPGEVVQEAAESVGRRECGGRRVGQGGVGRGKRETLGVPAQGTTGVVGADQPGIGRYVLGLRVELDG
jgi:hypothetical protein